MKRRDLFAEALALPPDDRVELAAELLASAPPPGVLSEDDPHFADELRRRIDQIENGETKTVPWSRVRAEVAATIDRERVAGKKRTTARKSAKR